MKEKFNTIFTEIFYCLAGASVIFALFETVKPGLVLAYININWVLILWLSAGIIALLTSKKKA